MMSTTFEVYPRTRDLPTFAAVVESATKELRRFFASIKIEARPCIRVRLQSCKDNVHLPFSLDAPAKWTKDSYAWFMVGDIRGGTDAYFADDVAVIREYWEGELQNPNCTRMEPAIRECMDIGHFWWFRRSMGQPATINLAYGLIAGTLAGLTNGIVYSMDSAWDWQRMPAYSGEFLSWYFRPELALDADRREWSRRCLDLIPSELAGDDDVYFSVTTA
jgi:hypothetical protein